MCTLMLAVLRTVFDFLIFTEIVTNSSSLESASVEDGVEMESSSVSILPSDLLP